MSNYKLTGSEDHRFHEIQNYWPVFEPIYNDEFVAKYRLFTAPLGQQFLPELIINSGGYSIASGAIQIEKIIHRFDDETEAVKFLTDIGPENITSYVEHVSINRLGQVEKIIEIQVINDPEVEISFDFNNGKIERGFFIETFRSGSMISGGVERIKEKVILSKDGQIISDTYLKYFKLKSDL